METTQPQLPLVHGGLTTTEYAASQIQRLARERETHRCKTACEPWNCATCRSFQAQIILCVRVIHREEA